MRPGSILAPLLLAAALASHGAAAETTPVEVRLGLLWPDMGPPGSRLPGSDANAELLFGPAGSDWAMGLPGWLRWAAAPRLDVGGALNSAGATSQAYAGLTWTVPLATGLLHQEDGLSVGLSIGPDLLGGPGTPRGLDQGPQLRLGAEIGYQVTPLVGLFVLFDHVTGGPLVHEADSLNELGVRVGLHF